MKKTTTPPPTQNAPTFSAAIGRLRKVWENQSTRGKCIIVGVLGVAVLLVFSGPEPAPTTQTPAKATTVKTAAAKPIATKPVITPEQIAAKEAEQKRLRAEEDIRLVSTSLPILKSFDTKECAKIPDACLVLLNSFAHALHSSYLPDAPAEHKALIKDFRNRLVNTQIEVLPIIRKSYAQTLDEKMWDFDVDVSASGKGNRTLTLIGGMFAANINIRKTQQELNTLVEKLRFSRVQYKWFKHAEEYTYYDLSHGYTDKSVLTWNDNGIIVDVKAWE